MIGRFTGIDPIAEKFNWVTPYNYAENRPSSGIDLWGLQYLDHNKARIIAQYGQVRLKLSNFHNVTANRIQALNNDSKNWKPGEIGINITVGQLSMKNMASPKAESANMDNTYGANDPTYNPSNIKTQRGEKKDGTPDMRQKERTVIGGPTGMGKTAAGGMLVLNAVNFGLEVAGDLMVNHDKNLVEQQTSADVLGKAIGDLNTALSKGMVPKEYTNVQGLTDILNVILQGENTTDNKAIMDIGTKILQEISKNYDEKKIKK